jgi:hypothetical protein
MMLRSLLLVFLPALVSSQVIAPMGVCFEEGAKTEVVIAFCRTKPDCMGFEESKKNGKDCYMRCNDMVDEFEEKFNCEDYGMVCYEGLPCIVPPANINDEGDWTR